MNSHCFSPLVLATLCLSLTSCDKPKGVEDAVVIPARKPPPVAVQHRLDAPASNAATPVGSTGSPEISPEIKAAFLVALETCKTTAAQLKKSEQPSVEQMETYNALWTNLPTQGLPEDLKEALHASSAMATKALPLFRSVMAKTASPDELASLKKLGHETNQAREKAIQLGTKYGLDFRFMK